MILAAVTVFNVYVVACMGRRVVSQSSRTALSGDHIKPLVLTLINVVVVNKTAVVTIINNCGWHAIVHHIP